MVGYDEDVLPGRGLKISASTTETRKGRTRLRSKRDQTAVVGQVVIDVVKERTEESFIVFFPTPVIESVRERMRKELAGKHGFGLEISSGGILTAICAKVSS
jgi:hypothetical protein